MLDLLSYYAGVVQRATSDTRQFLREQILGEFVIVLVAFIVGFAVQPFGALATGLLFTLAVLLGVVIVTFLWNLAWAPVNLARERSHEGQQLEQKVKELEESLAPKLAIEIDEPRRSPDGLRQFIRLRVMNNTHEPVMACGGKLMVVKPLKQRIAVTLPEPEQNLMWSSRGGGAPSLSRTINPKSPEYLDVAFTDNIVDEFYAGNIQGTAVHARVRQLMDDPFAYFNFVFLDYKAWRIPEGDYEVIIEVSGSNVATPTPISFRIVYEGGLNLYPEVLDKEKIA